KRMTGFRRLSIRRKRTTDGIFTSKVTLRIVLSSYSSTSSTFPRNRRVMARCHGTRATGCHEALRTSVSIGTPPFGVDGRREIQNLNDYPLLDGFCGVGGGATVFASSPGA